MSKIVFREPLVTRARQQRPVLPAIVRFLRSDGHVHYLQTRCHSELLRSNSAYIMDIVDATILSVGTPSHTAVETDEAANVALHLHE